ERRAVFTVHWWERYEGESMAVAVTPCIRTLRLKVKAEGYPWLNAAAVEINQVWNWANATSYQAARPFAGPARWLTGFDLDKLAAGASEYFEHIGSDTIQRVNAQFATRRRQFQRVKLKWRVSRGAKRSLGWIPFKAAQLKRKGKSLRFSGKAFRVFEQELLEGARWRCGCFAQDAVGDWWLCLPVERALTRSVAEQENILSTGRCPPSVSGNESTSSVAPTRQANRRCESGKSALRKWYGRLP